MGEYLSNMLSVSYLSFSVILLIITNACVCVIIYDFYLEDFIHTKRTAETITTKAITIKAKITKAVTSKGSESTQKTSVIKDFSS